jgi:hypothetical protein
MRVRLLACSCGPLVGAALLSPLCDLIKRAAGIKGSAQGLAGVVNAVNQVLTPITIVAVAVATLALIFGGGALMLGHPRALRIVGGVIAGLILIGGAKGIIA